MAKINQHDGQPTTQREPSMPRRIRPSVVPKPLETNPLSPRTLHRPSLARSLAREFRWIELMVGRAGGRLRRGFGTE